MVGARSLCEGYALRCSGRARILCLFPVRHVSEVGGRSAAEDLPTESDIVVVVS